MLEERDPALVKTLDTEFANVDAALAKHREGDGWKLHNELSAGRAQGALRRDQRAGEPISKVAAVVAAK